MEYGPLIEKKRARYHDLESEMASEGFYNDQQKSTEVMREYNRIKRLLESWEVYATATENLKQSEELAKGDDEEMAELAAEEIPELEGQVAKLDLEIQYMLLPRDETEDRDAIMEIRAGTGGDEASLFAADLMRMYQRYCEGRGWKMETLESSPSDVGGFKEVIIKVSGEEVFRHLKFESGVHRVQRVPDTETQGRIHTSTATVAVLPEAEEVDMDLKPDEVRIEVCRASGPGGQGVNTTDSAVQVMHLPTGIIVRCQDGRSQIKNRERALMILRSRILEQRQREEAEKYSEHRRSLIGGGGREEKIRTYNFPQNRITDHRVGLTVYNLEQVLAGQVDEFIEKLQGAEIEDRLKEAGLAG